MLCWYRFIQCGHFPRWVSCIQVSSNKLRMKSLLDWKNDTNSVVKRFPTSYGEMDHVLGSALHEVYTITNMMFIG